MELSALTNVNAYLKRMALETKWAWKQQTGNYTAKGSSPEDWLSPAQEEEGLGRHSDDKLTAIHTKLDAGGKLTPEERDYLRAKDPEAYRELIAEEQAQRAYEQALRRCRTREEVQRLHMGRIGRAMTAIQSVEHNPNIPLQKKLEIAMREKRGVDAAAECLRKFVRSGSYQALPTQAEEHQVQQEEKPFPPHPEDTPSPTRPQETPEHTLRPAPEPAEEDPPESPEAKKVRRARARAAYGGNTAPDPAQALLRPGLERRV